jgi:3-deoxy-7-phosphoheptulonate synthase
VPKLKIAGLPEHHSLDKLAGRSIPGNNAPLTAHTINADLDAPVRRPTVHWSPSSWRLRPALQQPNWTDPLVLAEVVHELGQLPPLVSFQEVDALRECLSDVASGLAIVIQGGDCAESFHDDPATAIRTVEVLERMASVIARSGVGVVTLGRMAGQFAKPRSSPIEKIGAIEIPSFRGHLVNSEAASVAARTPDPRRFLTAYERSAAVLRQVREHTSSIARDAPPRGRPPAAACDTQTYPTRGGIWTSHEALVLDYEEALTRCDASGSTWYDGSAHALWAGDRTRGLDDAHLHFLAGLANPVACKLGPSVTPETVLRICELLDPQRRPGRLTLIPRMGARKIHEHLPPLLRAVRHAGHPVLWMCDPMHANTVQSSTGQKTRHVDAIIKEVAGFVAVCRQDGTWPGGVHVELTGSPVTECVGGDVTEETLCLRYRTLCDPRLNPLQSMDLAARLADLLTDAA